NGLIVSCYDDSVFALHNARKYHFPASQKLARRRPFNRMSNDDGAARAVAQAGKPTWLQVLEEEIMLSLLRSVSAAAMLMATAAFAAPAAHAETWDIAKAAAPYKGTTLNVIFLDRPGYRAIEKLLPQFEKATGIKVSYEVVPYENTREKEVLNFSSQGDLSIALVDLVWLGEYAENGWIQPISKFTSDAAITDP